MKLSIIRFKQIQLLKTIHTILMTVYLISYVTANNNNIQTVPVANFTSSAEMTFVGHTVTLSDASTNSPTSWHWSISPLTFTYQNGTNTNSQNPQITFDAVGEYTIAMAATNASGSNTAYKKIYVVGTGSLTLHEDFSTITPTNWVIANPDLNNGWRARTVTGADGNSTQVIGILNYQYGGYVGQSDYLVMPKVNLSAISNPQLVFEIAYAPYSAQHYDRLYIDYSTDGGENYTNTSYDKSHLDLATSSYNTNDWTPLASEWRTETIDLSGYASTQTILRFILVEGYGSNLYIDNVRITGTVLPVELIHFKGKKVENGNLLNWSTASEQNNQGFEIERSSNGQDWKIIDFIIGAGTTTEQQDYEYLDKSISTTTTYYRLKQIDFDGKYEYSNIIQIEPHKSKSQIHIFPNPATEILTIDVTQPTLIQIINVSGQIVKEKIMQNTGTINISNLSKGVYFLKTNQFIQKFIIEK